MQATQVGSASSRTHSFRQWSTPHAMLTPLQAAQSAERSSSLSRQLAAQVASSAPRPQRTEHLRASVLNESASMRLWSALLAHASAGGPASEPSTLEPKLDSAHTPCTQEMSFSDRMKPKNTHMSVGKA